MPADALTHAPAFEQLYEVMGFDADESRCDARPHRRR